MKLLVCGSRRMPDVTGKYLVKRLMAEAVPPIMDERDIILIHGGAKGIDTLAGDYAKTLGWTVHEYPADWDAHGKAAGPIRNQQMLEMEHLSGDGIHLVLAFPAPDSRGTWDMVERAAKWHIPVRVYML